MPVSSLPAEAGLWASGAAAPVGQTQARLEPEPRRERPRLAEPDTDPGWSAAPNVLFRRRTGVHCLFTAE